MLSEKERNLLPSFCRMIEEIEKDEVLKLSSEAFAMGFLLGKKATNRETELQYYKNTKKEERDDRPDRNTKDV